MSAETVEHGDRCARHPLRTAESVAHTPFLPAARCRVAHPAGTLARRALPAPRTRAVMPNQDPPLDLQVLESLAPDASSLAAARSLLKPAKWPLLARDDELLWALCQGSGTAPYRAVFALADRGSKCTCPSRKFPCKHVLALVWMHVEDPTRFVRETQRPDWVLDWLGRRRGPRAKADTENEPANVPAAPRVDLAAVVRELDAPAVARSAEDDEKSAARSAAQRERNRVQREAQILAGLDELDRWLGDRMTQGLAAFAAQSADPCRVIARRLADAKAGALSARVDALPARIAETNESERADFLVSSLAELHLVAAAYRRQDQFGAGLRADVRRHVGWSVTRESLAEDPDTLRVHGTWDVLAVRDEVQPDRLRRIDTWLRARGGAHAALDRGFALLVDYVPVASGAAVGGFSAGEAFEATLLLHTSEAPLRASLDEHGSRRAESAPLSGAMYRLGDELDRVDGLRARVPWLEQRPIAARGLVLRHAPGGRPWLCDVESGHAVPLAGHREEETLPLAGLAPFDAIATWDGRIADLLCAQTELGVWRRM